MKIINNTPIRVQRKRTKGWRMPENTVCVSRPSKFGNPFKLTIDGWILYYKTGKIVGSPWCYWSNGGGFTALCIINLYEQWITGKLPKFLPPVPDVSELRGKNLACFCPLDFPCHADVLLKLANIRKGDRIDIGTGYSCDRGTVIESNNKEVKWESDMGGIYTTPFDRYNISKI